MSTRRWYNSPAADAQGRLRSERRAARPVDRAEDEPIVAVRYADDGTATLVRADRRDGRRSSS